MLGVVRLGLDADWDRMGDVANLHLLVRQMPGDGEPPCPPPKTAMMDESKFGWNCGLTT